MQPLELPAPEVMLAPASDGLAEELRENARLREGNETGMEAVQGPMWVQRAHGLHSEDVSTQLSIGRWR
jgi:hypothetical protein